MRFFITVTQGRTHTPKAFLSSSRRARRQHKKRGTHTTHTHSAQGAHRGMPTCAYAGCSADAQHMCGRCRQAHYCCSDHQRAAWPTHKNHCRKTMAPPNDSASAAGALLAQKATFIANQLGLDPSLPLSELMAAASRRMGVATNVSSDEMHKADALISSARQSGAVHIEAPQHDGGSYTCRSCGQTATQVCSVNGCCARCVYEVAHFDKIGHSAISAGDEQELGHAGGPRGSWAFASRSNPQSYCVRPLPGLTADDLTLSRRWTSFLHTRSVHLRRADTPGLSTAHRAPRAHIGRRFRRLWERHGAAGAPGC